ncbi:uncharacterized protein LOC128675160 isoform X2 [Plodia interpunctella]|uniref:uncharacterized protein LOC128675160 isoform X2 n=1 Tax=Plodia interpunctella TaxID=58824 RepID=UPI0023685833|nr:uncharacterized protein LOC128675160 isoform X2 [Plodia interpunctella]
MGFCKAIIVLALATVYLTVTAEEEAHEDRGFFSLFPSIVPCNYTEQRGSSCISCNQSLLCFSNNVGLLWNCGGLLPNCNQGHCSTVRPDNCTSA